jgi:hypothetical protein
MPTGSDSRSDAHQRFPNLWLISIGGKLVCYAAVLMFWIQFALVLGAILLGGVALGMIGGLGVAVLTLGFREQPGCFAPTRRG